MLEKKYVTNTKANKFGKITNIFLCTKSNNIDQKVHIYIEVNKSFQIKIL